MHSSLYFALDTSGWLCGDIALWIGLVAIESNRRRGQIMVALWGLLLTAVSGLNWFVSRLSTATVDAWLSVSMIVFAFGALCWLMVALLHMRRRLKVQG